MSTTSTDSTAASPAFGKFALVFSIAFVICYWVCAFKGWPLFTYHPATNTVGWGREAAAPGTGPAMYWYGWTAMCFIVGIIAGFVGTFLPDSMVKHIPLVLVWLLPLLAFPLMFYAVIPLLTHG